MGAFEFPSDPVEAARVFNAIRAEYLQKLGIEFEEISAEKIVATMPVAGNTQRFDVLHGGATTSLVETLASVGAEASLRGANRAIMGQEQSCHFLAASRAGRVRGVARPIHIGRTTQVWDVEVSSAEEGRRVAVGRVTIAIREIR
jgi:1,4-dihydroxy-2-naphthoyl-CoA hydrolase